MGELICIEKYKKKRQVEELTILRERVRRIVDSIEKSDPEMYVTPNLLANLLYIVT